MSQDKLDEIRKRIEQIDKIGKTPQNSKETMHKRGEKTYGSYQHFQSECMQRIDPDDPNSPSRIEVITNQYGAHSTERMAQCSRLWKKKRSLPDPIQGLMEELKTAEKIESGDFPEQ